MPPMCVWSGELGVPHGRLMTQSLYELYNRVVFFFFYRYVRSYVFHKVCICTPFLYAYHVCTCAYRHSCRCAFSMDGPSYFLQPKQPSEASSWFICVCVNVIAFEGGFTPRGR